MATLEDWLQWKQVCALALCRLTTQSALCEMVGRRFRQYVAGYASGSGFVSALSPQDAWHGFETYFQLHRTRQGKGYKEWLFARGPDPASDQAAALAAVESGVSLLLRNVVREHLRQELPSSRCFSTQEFVDGVDSSSMTLEELLPGPSDTQAEVEQRELEQLAHALVGDCLAQLTTRERIALLARELGLSCRHPGAQKAAGCDRTALAQAFPIALGKIARQVARVHSSEPRGFLASLTIQVFQAVREALFQWLRSDKARSALLIPVEDMVGERLTMAEGVGTGQDDGSP